MLDGHLVSMDKKKHWFVINQFASFQTDCTVTLKTYWCLHWSSVFHCAWFMTGKSLRQSSQRFDMVAMRKRSIPEGYVKVIQDMYRGTKTRVKTRCRRTEYFEVKVGLNQGSALSQLLFIITMDVLAEESRTKPPWAMLFADDLVLVSETVEEVEEVVTKTRLMTMPRMTRVQAMIVTSFVR